MVVIRGKTGRGVPVILPADVKGVLRYLSDSGIRSSAGIQPGNPYVFANNRAGVFRAYDAIREVTQEPEAGLELPHLVRTSNMRKYMATMLQVLNTTEAERQWVIDHLGHTMNVHQVHYRQTSDVLERVDVAKVLLIQDLALVGKYRGQRLQDINLDEMVKDAVAEPEADPCEGDSDVAVPPACDVTSFQGQTDLDEDYIPEMPVEEEDGDNDDDFFQTRKRRKCSSVVRQKWTSEEVDELLKLFKTDFETNRLPGQKRIQDMIKSSLKNNGFIHKRKRDTIKKK